METQIIRIQSYFKKPRIKEIEKYSRWKQVPFLSGSHQKRGSEPFHSNRRNVNILKESNPSLRLMVR